MFANNQKISARQMRRLLTFDLLGIGTLLLPARLALLCGNRGWWCILAGGGAAVLYLLLLKKAILTMRIDIYSYINNNFVITGLIFMMILFGGFCLRTFVDLVRWSLVPDESFFLIAALIIIVSIYAVSGGLESRARVYEILFLIVLIPLVIMLLGASSDVKWLYLSKGGHGEWKEFVTGSGLVFMQLSVIFFVLFFPGNVSEAKARQIIRNTGVALGITIGILLCLYVILAGAFGARALANMKYPVVTLMSTVQVKGSFLKRTDALMCGIWFFTLFAILNMNLFNGAKGFRKIVGVKEKWSILFTGFAIFALALLFEYEEGAMERFIKFMGVFGVPIILLLPLVIVLRGCNSTELESRCFPMMMVLDYRDKQVELSYVFPKSKEWSSIAPVSTDSFMDSKEKYEDNLNKLADLNHLKIILMSESYINNRKAVDELVNYGLNTESLPRNVYVCVTEAVSGILNTSDNMTQDLGTYIEELLENHPMRDRYGLVTVGQLIDESSNRLQSLYAPYLKVEKDTIVWEKLYEINFCE